MKYWGTISACVLGLLAVAALLRGRCRHCGARTYFRRSYCSTCRLIVASYGYSERGGGGSGGSLPAGPAHWTSAGTGTTPMEGAEGGSFGVPLLLMSFAVFVFVVYFFLGNSLSSKITGARPQPSQTPTPAKEQVFADRRRRLYYPARCGDADGIPAKAKVTFNSDTEAAKAGYKESPTCP